MNFVFVLMLLCGICTTLFTAGGDAVLAFLSDGAASAVTLCISLLGAYLFWMGILGVARQAGLLESISRLLQPCIRYLFPNAKKASGAISMNLAANLLGMGNAATPFGLEAIRILDEANPRRGVATNEMCVLLAINASCLELFPATLIALRQSMGSLHPASVVLPTLLSSACATAVAVVACRYCVSRA